MHVDQRQPSRGQLFAELWLRTVRRFQEGLLDAAAQADDPVERAVAAAGWTVDFAAERPADARLLAESSPQRLLAGDPPDALRHDLEEVNAPVAHLLRGLARDLYGSSAARHVETVTIAVVDLPYATVRRHLMRGTSPAGQRARVQAAARALLVSARDV